MTEDEAKTKWCPAVRMRSILDYAVRSGNAKPGRDADILCIASACMAWQWSDEKRAAAYLEAVAAHMKATGESFNKRREEFAYTEGYCGLAGKP